MSQPFLFSLAPPKLETPLDIWYFSISGFCSGVGRGEQSREGWAQWGGGGLCPTAFYSSAFPSIPYYFFT